MGCVNCGTKFQGQCDACRLVDNDLSIKPVFYCETCNAYLCSDCNTQYAKRTLAAGLQLANKVSEKISSYFQKKSTDQVIVDVPDDNLKSYSVLSNRFKTLNAEYRSLPKGDPKKRYLKSEISILSKQLRELESITDLNQDNFKRNRNEIQ